MEKFTTVNKHILGYTRDTQRKHDIKNTPPNYKVTVNFMERVSLFVLSPQNQLSQVSNASSVSESSLEPLPCVS